MLRRLALPALSLALTAAALTACDSPPSGARGSRVDPGITTKAERHSAKITPVSLIEFSDQASQRLAQDIAEMPEIRGLNDGGQRATIILGDINNKTGVVSSNDFEMMTRRMRQNLLTSNYARDRMKFVTERARMSAIRERELVGPNEGNAEPANYDAANSFALNGDFYRVARGNTNRYYMEFQLVSFKTNEIVWSDRYEMGKIAEED
jgi:hypothetical protein